MKHHGQVKGYNYGTDQAPAPKDNESLRSSGISLKQQWINQQVKRAMKREDAIG